MVKKFKVHNKVFRFDKTIPEEFSIVDSFVQITQQTGTGNGEKKFYFGGQGTPNIDFFGGRYFKARSFISRDNLISHLNDLKPEYMNPTQKYNPRKRGKDDLSDTFIPRLDMLKGLNKYHEFSLNYYEDSSRRYATGIIQKQDTNVYSDNEVHKAGSHRYQIAYASIFLIPIPKFSALSVDRYISDDKETVFLFSFNLKQDIFSNTKHHSQQNEKKKFSAKSNYKKRFNPSSKRWRSGAARRSTDIVDKAEIYEVRFTVDQKTYVYVGQDSHCSGIDSYFGSSLVIFHFEEVYGSELFDKKILKTLHNISQKELNTIERDFIDKSEKECQINGWFNINYTGQNQ
jgi:hypothetical protein